MEHLADRLARIPGVEAVALGGSRARGEGRRDSDWDFGLYYRDRIEADDVRALGFEGDVVEPGAWGRLVNGGAWLTVDGQRVDLLYRELGFVQHWVDEANEGRFEIDLVEGYVAGMATSCLPASSRSRRSSTGSFRDRPFRSRSAAPRRCAGTLVRHFRSPSRRRPRLAGTLLGAPGSS
jgi:hypothetical protein